MSWLLVAVLQEVPCPGSLVGREILHVVLPWDPVAAILAFLASILAAMLLQNTECLLQSTAFFLCWSAPITAEYALRPGLIFTWPWTASPPKALLCLALPRLVILENDEEGLKAAILWIPSCTQQPVAEMKFNQVQEFFHRQASLKLTLNSGGVLLLWGRNKAWNCKKFEMKIINWILNSL